MCSRAEDKRGFNLFPPQPIDHLYTRRHLFPSLSLLACTYWGWECNYSKHGNNHMENMWTQRTSNMKTWPIACITRNSKNVMAAQLHSTNINAEHFARMILSMIWLQQQHQTVFCPDLLAVNKPVQHGPSHSFMRVYILPYAVLAFVCVCVLGKTSRTGKITRPTK